MPPASWPASASGPMYQATHASVVTVRSSRGPGQPVHPAPCTGPPTPAQHPRAPAVRHWQSPHPVPPPRGQAGRCGQ
eukprot:scaffold231013_cov22-Tisochrysis_lutea.AAC.1